MKVLKDKLAPGCPFHKAYIAKAYIAAFAGCAVLEALDISWKYVSDFQPTTLGNRLLQVYPPLAAVAG